MDQRLNERRGKIRTWFFIMEKEIINKVAKSPIVTLDLEEYYPEGERLKIDISQWLYKGIVVKEKEYRSSLNSYDFSKFKDTYVAIHCSTNAILPSWSIMLLSTYLNQYVKKCVFGSILELEQSIYADILSNLDITPFKNRPLIIKGCSKKNIPETVFLLAIEKLQPHVKSIFYGEACSSVPLFKKKNG